MITCISMVFPLPVFPLIFSPVAVSPSIVYSVILYSTIFSFSMDCHWMVGLTLVSYYILTHRNLPLPDWPFTSLLQFVS